MLFICKCFCVKIVPMSKRNLYPKDYIESTYAIDFLKLYEQGYRGVIFDVDNTLVPHNAPADERAKALFKEPSRRRLFTAPTYIKQASLRRQAIKGP